MEKPKSTDPFDEIKRNKFLLDLDIPVADLTQEKYKKRINSLKLLCTVAEAKEFTSTEYATNIPCKFILDKNKIEINLEKD